VKLVLQRLPSTPACTLGSLSVDGVFACYTLEDVVRQGPKVYGATAIPAGTYPVVITQSPRFKRPLPLLLNVPGFEGVRIHPGNTAADTEGCILVGRQHGPSAVLESRLAFNALFEKLKAAKRPVTIEIRSA
jgi:hypothetical protein